MKHIYAENIFAFANNFYNLMDFTMQVILNLRQLLQDAQKPKLFLVGLLRRVLHLADSGVPQSAIFTTVFQRTRRLGGALQMSDMRTRKGLLVERRSLLLGSMGSV